MMSYTEFLIRANSIAEKGNKLASIWGDAFFDRRAALASKLVQTAGVLLSELTAAQGASMVQRLQEELRVKYPHKTELSYWTFQLLAKFLGVTVRERKLLTVSKNSYLVFSDFELADGVGIGIVHCAVVEKSNAPLRASTGEWWNFDEEPRCSVPLEEFRRVATAYAQQKYAGKTVHLNIDLTGDTVTFVEETLASAKVLPEITIDDKTVQLQEIADRCLRFRQAGLRRTILLLGPPGTGKTTAAQYIMSVVEGYHVQVAAKVFAAYNNSFGVLRSFVPFPIVVNDIDRARVDDITALLAVFEKSVEPVLGIFTINTIEFLDRALLRHRRVDEMYEVGLPDLAARRRLVKLYLPLAEEETVEKITNSCEGLPQSAINELCDRWRILEGRDFEVEVENVRAHHTAASQLSYKQNAPAVAKSLSEWSPN